MDTAVRHWGLVLSFSDRAEEATVIPYDSNGILSVNLHVSNPNTYQTSNAKAPIPTVLTMQFEDSQPRSDKIGTKIEDPPKRNRLIVIENKNAV